MKVIKGTNSLRENIRLMIKDNTELFMVEFASWFWLLRTSFRISDPEYKFIEKTMQIIEEEYRKEYNTDIFKVEFLKRGRIK